MSRVTGPGVPARPSIRLRRATGLALVGLAAALLAPVVSAPAPAAAVSYDVASHALKFQQSKRSAVSPSGATGRNVGDVMKYSGVATIEGTVIDAVVTTVAFSGLTVSKFDEGSAVTAPPPGSSQSVDDLLLTDVDAPANAPGQLTYSFAFYEGGTYTGVGTGVPVTLANAVINTYDIDGNGGAKQYVDFSGFQTYTVYSQSATRGIDLENQGGGLVRFITRDGSFNAATGTGSYSFTRVQVNYDRISSLTVRLGLTAKSPAYFALDFSAGGIWTTDGVNPVSPYPQPQPNPFNTPPTTSDVTTFFAALDAGYVFRSADFPYADLDDNVFAALRIPSLPAAGTGALEYFDGVAWVPVTADQVISTTDLDLGRLRLIPEPSGGSFTFAVNDGLADSIPATLTFTAATSPQTISFPVPETQNGLAQRVLDSGATASSGLTPTLTSETPGVCTVSGLQITTLVLPTGVTTATCVVTATQDGSPEYGRAEAVTVRFPVTRLTPQTITFGQPDDRAVTSPAFASGAATSAAGLSVTLSSLTPTVCTVSGGDITPVAPGLCSVRASQAGSATYAPASPVTRTFTVLKAAQTITFAQPPTRAVDVGTITIAPTADSGLAVSLASSTTSVCTVSGTTVTIRATGTCTLTASQAGDATRLAATDVTRSFAVFGVSTTSLADGQVGTAYAQQLTVDGAEGGGSWSSTTLPAGLTLTASTGRIAGTPTETWSDTVTVTYTEGGASHSVELDLEIEAPALLEQEIDFANPGTRSFAAASITVAPTADSGLTVTLVSGTTGVCTVSGLTVTFVTGGTCSLTASQAGDAVYAAAEDVTVSFRILRVTTPSLATGRVGVAYAQSQSLLGAAGGGTWTASELPGGLTIDPATGALGGTPTEQTPDEVTITYTEAGVAHAVTLDLVIDPRLAQALTFPAPPAASRSAGTVTFAPTTDAAGLTPVLTSETPAVCSVSGFVVTFVGAGTCTITATQPGDATRAAAGAVSRSFPVIELPTQSLPQARVGETYTRQLQVAGSGGGGVWAVVGTLPAGLVLDPVTGILSGTPTESFDDLITFSYTEGGVVETVVIDLCVQLATEALAVTGVDARPSAALAAALLLAGAVLAVWRPRRPRGAHRA